VTGADSLEAFLRDMRKRYPDSSAISQKAADSSAPAAATPPPKAPAAAAPPQADRTPTGSISGR
jgi:hypothetical protein